MPASNTYTSLLLSRECQEHLYLLSCALSTNLNPTAHLSFPPTPITTMSSNEIYDFAGQATDLVLEVGSGPAYLRVQTELLEKHSPVFAAMCSPQLFESVIFDGSGTRHLSLPDDDPDLFRAIFYAIHGQFASVTTMFNILGFTTILKVIILANKYRMVSVFNPWVGNLVVRIRRSLQLLNNSELLSCALILRSIGETETLFLTIYILAHFARRNNRGEMFLPTTRSQTIWLDEEESQTLLRECLHGIPPLDAGLNLIGT
ncbi:Putative protein of unknown function [Podospora comata]|uniref:BTB domain-containing protein n=1 Tax=Podospora comata TaxID=48703 RepID=A0ABY6S0E9_PODCO|nr:Putative protein of unknown function [Podospora comata]